MSEQNRGPWGSRDDGMWWPSSIAAEHQSLQQQQQQQHILHHQQQLAAQQLQCTSAASQQQTFSYKMASSFQNPATTVSTVSSTSPAGSAATIRSYDYRLGGGMGVNTGMSGPAPASQWWYSGALDNSSQNIQSSLQGAMQNMSSVSASPPVVCISQARFYFSVCEPRSDEIVR